MRADKAGWKTVRLGDICTPKQWKTISAAQLTDSGYPVYGANGVIGFYHQYNHEKETLLVTCRGATCGSLNICVPKSYVNGNAMALDDLDASCDVKFLYYYLKHRGFSDVISGSAQPQIIRSNLEKVKVPLAPLETQRYIAKTLDTAWELVSLHRRQISELDDLLRSVFLDMFGDPATNEKGWETDLVGNLFPVASGGTPVTTKAEYWENGNIPWIGSNLCQNVILYENDGKYITRLGLEKSSAKVFDAGTVLVALVGATIGKAALLRFATTTNQNVAGIRVKENENFTPEYVFFAVRSLYHKFLELAHGGFKMANLSFIRNLEIMVPPLVLQRRFAEMVLKTEEQRALVQKAAEECEYLFDSLMNRFFSRQSQE